LREIVADDIEKVTFVQRLAGYWATGETREQVIAFLVGEGANGKSTLLDAIRDVLGDYAATAPPGFLTGRGAENRHPTEVMDLMGRRLLTCNESDQGADLREGHVKQLTGETVLKGRRMHQDFSEFKNTAKLVLSTNHKPIIQGADYGIWRRLRLVMFDVKFGTADEVEAGTATRVKDPKLAAALLDEREGVFAWIVEGSKVWYRFGLETPESVLTATSEYQSDSDRAKQFVTDNCALDKGAWVTITDLCQAYQIWCIEHGYRALGWGKLRDELQRVVPHFRQDTRRQGARSAGQRKTVRGCYGLKLSGTGADAFDTLPAIGGADGAPPIASNLDLV
jgi:putative DNA primase/helicase